MKQQTVNEFKDGLNLDLHPLVTPKTVLTDNLNGTFITYNGNEFCLQNDRGNKEVTIKQKLSTGYVPIGIKEHNGILYIVSHNPSTHKTEIGTYPGINWNLQNGTLDDKKYTSLCNYYHKNVSEHRYTIYSRYDSDELYDAGIEINEDDVKAIADSYGALYDGGILFGDPGTGSDYIYFLDENVRDTCFNAINTQFPNIFTTWELDEDVTGTLIPMQFTADYSLLTPVTIEVQDSYDGSVNLILVADNCKTRIINTGFSAKPNKQYELIERNQSVATNYYTVENFDKETELIRTSAEITNIDLIGVQSGGQFKGGNYTFYIKFGDADYNQTDVVAESGIVSIFNGNDGIPSTISGTLLDERTDKMIHLEVQGLNHVYSKIYIYYSREYSDTQGYRMTEYGMFAEPIDLKESYVRNNQSCQDIWLTGFEQTTPIDSELLNVDYHTIDWARAEAQHSNMLFLGNVGQEKTFQLYQDLKEYTKDFIVEIRQDLLNDDIVKVSNDYKSGKEYYSTANIYSKLGYWPDEIYRFGIVYILKDGSTTPVFNVTGGTFSSINSTIDTNQYVNEYGVFRTPKADIITNTNSIHPLYFNFSLPNDISLLEENNIVGWFVVRQKRIPRTICQGLSIGIDEKSNLPMVWNGDNWMIESFLSLDRSDKDRQQALLNEIKKLEGAYKNTWWQILLGLSLIPTLGVLISPWMLSVAITYGAAKTIYSKAKLEALKNNIMTSKKPMLYYYADSLKEFDLNYYGIQQQHIEGQTYAAMYTDYSTWYDAYEQQPKVLANEAILIDNVENVDDNKPVYEYRYTFLNHLAIRTYLSEILH